MAVVRFDFFYLAWQIVPQSQGNSMLQLNEMECNLSHKIAVVALALVNLCNVEK